MRTNERTTAPATPSHAGRAPRAGGRGPAAPGLAARRLLVLAAAAALAWPRAAPAMEVAAGADGAGRFVIRAAGPIRAGDADRVRHALDAAGAGRRTSP